MSRKIPVEIEVEVPERFHLESLQNHPTISTGHFDNLKFEGRDTRIWLSRMTVEDGQPYNNMVTVEKLIRGVWVVAEQYEAL